jgi:predicted DNA-binding transcriptional regulator AlpA
MTDKQQAPSGSSSIKEFCRRHRIALSTFYELDKIGKAPRTIRLGSKIRRITYQAEANWLAEREAEAAQ